MSLRHGIHSSISSVCTCYCFPEICLMLFVKTLDSCTQQCHLQLRVCMCLLNWGQVETCSNWQRYPELKGSWLLVLGARMTHGLEAENGGKQLPHSANLRPFLPWAKPGLSLWTRPFSCLQWVLLTACRHSASLGTLLLIPWNWMHPNGGSYYSTAVDCLYGLHNAR